MTVVTDKLNMRYGGSEKGISYLDFSGEGLICLYGGEASGKTTLLKCIAGLENYEGKVIVNGRERQAEADGGIIMLFDDYGLFGNKTALFNAAYPYLVRKSDKAEALRRADELLKKAGIYAKRSEKAKNLSDKEKLMLALTRLERGAELYLIDNPLKRFCGEERKKLFFSVTYPVLQKLGENADVIYATDDLSELEALQESVLLINFGSRKGTGKLGDLMKNPPNLFCSGIMSDKVIFEARLSADGTCPHIAFGEEKILLPQEGRLLDEDYRGKTVKVSADCEAGADGGLTAVAQGCGFLSFEGCVFRSKLAENLLKNEKININLTNICLYDYVSEGRIY